MTKRNNFYSADKIHELDLIAQALIEKETLTAAELKEIVFGKEETETPMIDLSKNFPAESSVDLSKTEEKISEPNFNSENPAAV